MAFTIPRESGYAAYEYAPNAWYYIGSTEYLSHTVWMLDDGVNMLLDGNQIVPVNYFGSDVEYFPITDPNGKVWEKTETITLNYPPIYNLTPTTITGTAANDDITAKNLFSLLGINGGNGNDVIDVSYTLYPLFLNHITLTGGEGDDWISYDGYTHTMFSPPEHPLPVDSATLEGGNGNDLLKVSDVDATLTGGAGNDLFFINVKDPQQFVGGTWTQNVVITDFSPENFYERIIFENYYSPFVEPVFSDVEGGAQIKIGQITILLNGVSASELTPINFLYSGYLSTSDFHGDNMVGTPFPDYIDSLSGNDTVHGSQGDDTINGGLGDDYIYGDSGTDSIRGDEGNDHLFTGSGHFDNLQGGDGDDVLTVDAESVFQSMTRVVFLYGDYQYGTNGGADHFVISKNTFCSTLISIEDFRAEEGDKIDLSDFDITFEDLYIPTGSECLIDGYSYIQVHRGDGSAVGLTESDFIFAAPNSIKGTPFADTLTGSESSENIFGRDGNDLIYGNAGEDSLHGEGGADTLHGGINRDSMSGGDGNDSISSYADNDTLIGGIGDDSLFAGMGDDSLDGGDGNDLLLGEYGSDTIYGGVGNDGLLGWDGNDFLYGGDGDDGMQGEAGADSLEGGAGNDSLYGGDDSDTLHGGADADYLEGDNNNDQLYGENGNDVLAGSNGNDSLYGGAGMDYVFGEYGDDSQEGGDGNDVLYGWDGNDTLKGDAGNDALVGEAGMDSLEGGDGNDTLYGGEDAGVLNGGAGSDHLEGGSGNDTLHGGANDDGIFSGTGSDIFLYTAISDSAGNGRDVIYDFAQGIDKLDLSAIVGSVSFIGGSSFNGSGAEIRWYAQGGLTVMELDSDGNSSADMQFIFAGSYTTFSAADLV